MPVKMNKNQAIVRDRKASIYPNGEVVTKGRMEEEFWYPDYQAMMEIAVRNEFGDSKGLLRAFEEDFVETMGRAITPEAHVRFDRWARLEHKKSEEYRKEGME